MKKNDVMGYIVYALMLGGAVGVGFGVIRPILNDTSVAKELPMPGILLILLSKREAGILRILCRCFGTWTRSWCENRGL